MPQAGDIITVPTVPGHNVATTISTSDSSTFGATEVEVMSVTALLVNGRTYRIRFAGGVASTDTTSVYLIRIEEDNLNGDTIQGKRILVDTTNGVTGLEFSIEAKYEAQSTGNKTFVVTGQRTSGSGTGNLAAGSTFPNYVDVDYIRG